jgi:hypothetical protein
MSFYNNVIDIRRDTVGVRIRRIRIRADALLGQGRRNAEGITEGVNGSGVPWADFALFIDNPLIALQGSSFEVSDSDLWATWAVFASHGPLYRTDAYTPGARYGLIQRNTLYHGAGCHWFGQTRELIFESNQCIGNNPEAGGNSIQSYGGGYAQHIYMGSNEVADGYGGDHEVMTFDNPGGGYLGPVDSVASDGVHLSIINVSAVYDGTMPSGQPRPCTGPTFQCQVLKGGAMVVFSGQGQGQYRRIVSWPDNSGTSWNWTHGTFEIDRPLDAPLGPDSVVQVMPYRGQMIFHRNHYRDCGVFQLYSYALENLVHSNIMERGGGFVNRGFDVRKSQKGIGGGYVNPAQMNQFIGNEIVPGAASPHQGHGIGADWGDSDEAGGFSVFSAASAINRYLIFKRNRLAGVIFIGVSDDILVEANVIHDTPATESSFRQVLYVQPGNNSTLSVGNIVKPIGDSAGDDGDDEAPLKTDGSSVVAAAVVMTYFGPSRTANHGR